ncbi:MAG: hypothetical protein HJJLKODD_02969 [Phycisphaerae bacterium]|nr:hypothetical protein [Phycisphaerae bacterium]
MTRTGKVRIRRLLVIFLICGFIFIWVEFYRMDYCVAKMTCFATAVRCYIQNEGEFPPTLQALQEHACGIGGHFDEVEWYDLAEGINMSDIDSRGWIARRHRYVVEFSGKGIPYIRDFTHISNVIGEIIHQEMSTNRSVIPHEQSNQIH